MIKRYLQETGNMPAVYFAQISSEEKLFQLIAIDLVPILWNKMSRAAVHVSSMKPGFASSSATLFTGVLIRTDTTLKRFSTPLIPGTCVTSCIVGRVASVPNISFLL